MVYWLVNSSNKLEQQSCVMLIGSWAQVTRFDRTIKGRSNSCPPSLDQVLGVDNVSFDDAIKTSIDIYRHFINISPTFQQYFTDITLKDILLIFKRKFTDIFSTFKCSTIFIDIITTFSQHFCDISSLI